MSIERAWNLVTNAIELIPEEFKSALEEAWDEGYEARIDEDNSSWIEYGSKFVNYIPNPYREE